MSETESESPATRGSVLLVEDDANLRDILAEYLREQFDVVAVGGVLEALAALDTTLFHVVLADYLMPSGTGVDLLNAVIRRFPDMAAILLTGHSESKEVEAARQSGRFLVLFKPIQPSELALWIERSVVSSGMYRIMKSIKEKSKRLGELVEGRPS